MKNAPNFLLIDLFCGAGGTTTGAEMSGVCKVIAAVNHDPLAIKSHAANHADVLHLTEDILVADIRPVLKAVRHWQRIYPDAKMVLWASLECTNFSNAKGGMPRDADSRALANGLFRYLDALNPDYLLIENVKEFMSWGPLVPKVVKKKCGDFCPLHYDRKSGQMRSNLIPESRTRGKFYVHWVNKVKAYGYQHDYRLLNAANFGGVTIRERYFAAFWKPKVAFAWPQPTHAKRPQSSPMFNDNLKPWRPVAQVLDFEDMGKSIFDRKKPLVDRTLSRILAGLQKFYNRPSVMTCNTPGYCTDTDTPVGTITTTCHKALVTPILQSYYGNGQCTSINNPAPTCTTKDRMALVSPVTWICTNAFIVNPQYKNAGSSILDPAPTVIARQKSYPLALATPADSGTPKWEPKPADSKVMLALKAFMRDNGIADVRMRMLKELELKRIQGFPDDYVLHGPQNEKKKFIGNSVETGVVKAWFRAMANALKSDEGEPKMQANSTTIRQVDAVSIF